MDIQNPFMIFLTLVVALALVIWFSQLLYLLIIYIGDSTNKVLVKTTDREKAADVLERRWHKIERVARITAWSFCFFLIMWCMTLYFNVS